MDIKKTIKLIMIATIFLLFLFCSIYKVQATNELTLISNEKFEIPTQNGTIKFAANGTYEDAHLESDKWIFINLQFLDFPQQEKRNLTVSAQNCDLEITSYRSVTSNTTLGSIRLRYAVVGQGTQSFNFGNIPEGGIWNVVIDNVFVGQEDGWTVSAKTVVIVTSAESNSNVSIIYYTYPNSFVTLQNQSFLERNSIAIATTITLAITIVLAIAAKKIVAEPQKDPHIPVEIKMTGKEKQ